MATDVSVLIPFAGSCPHRLRALRWVVASLHSDQPEWQIVIGGIRGQWCKADAVQNAAARASGDVLVVHDADVRADQTADAVGEVAAGAPWAIPHRMVRRLSEAGTESFMRGESAELSERPYAGRAGGGIVVLPRETWAAVPLDRRFIGWGQEDESWALALTVLAGKPIRLGGDLMHLWHPPQSRLSRSIGSREGQKLYRRYVAAKRYRHAMRSLVEESKVAEWIQLG